MKGLHFREKYYFQDHAKMESSHKQIRHSCQIMGVNDQLIPPRSHGLGRMRKSVIKNSSYWVDSDVIHYKGAIIGNTIARHSKGNFKDPVLHSIK